MPDTWSCGCDAPDLREVDHGDNPDNLPDETYCMNCFVSNRDGLPVY